MQVAVRRMTARDLAAVGQLMTRAFNEVFEEHGYPPPFGGVRDGVDIARWYHQTEPESCFVSEVRTQVVACAFLHKRGVTASVGPVAVDPRFQKLGLGRRLMEHIIAEAAGCTSVRLFQDAFNPGSFALYAKLGFRPVEIVPIVLLPVEGSPGSLSAPTIRFLDVNAGPALAKLDTQLTGADRGRDLQYLLETGIGLVLREGGRDVGYLCAYFSRGGVYVGPAAAERTDQLHALVHAARNHYSDYGMIFRLPSRHYELTQLLLQEGFRIASLGTLMARGEWRPTPAPDLLAVFPESL